MSTIGRRIFAAAFSVMLPRSAAMAQAAPTFPLVPVSRAKPDRSPEAKTAFARTAQRQISDRLRLLHPGQKG
jgi:hypothetical protein